MKKFTPFDLFSGETFPAELVVTLSAMCQWPNRIKRLFQKSDINNQGVYLVKINRSGQWSAMVIDDKIPVKDPKTLEPFTLPPLNHLNGTKINDEDLTFESKKEIYEKTEEVEIWPLLISKALSKAFLNYERMLTQDLRNYLRNLTGMPVRDYQPEKIDFTLLRVCFKRQHIIVGKMKEEFIQLAKEKCDLRGTGEELLSYWILNHPIILDGGEKWVEMIHPHCVAHQMKGKINNYFNLFKRLGCC